MSFDRRITPYRPDLADERLRGLVEAERFSKGTLRRVMVPVAPLRRNPSPDAALETEALMGELVTIYDEHEGFAWGQLRSDGYVGYLPTAALGEPGPEPTHKVGAIRTFIYPGPSLKLPPMDFLCLGAQVTVSGAKGDYSRLASGGYVFTGHLVGLDARCEDYVALAERLIGTPYLWGGKTTLGLDCSSLVQTVLAAGGISAPRDSDMQEKEIGTPLAVGPGFSGLQRGDLVFWNGHVGIMTDERHLLHANGNSMDVAVEPLAVAEERIRTKSYGPITSFKRVSRAG